MPSYMKLRFHINYQILNVFYRNCLTVFHDFSDAKFGSDARCICSNKWQVFTMHPAIAAECFPCFERREISSLGFMRPVCQACLSAFTATSIVGQRPCRSRACKARWRIIVPVFMTNRIGTSRVRISALRQIVDTFDINRLNR